MSPGFSTSEFRLTAVFSALASLVTAFKPDLLTTEAAAQLIAAVVAVYSISRGIVKGFSKPPA